MSLLLQRLGRFSFRRRRTVLATWLGVLVAVGAVAAMAGGTFSSNFTIPGTESQKAVDLLAQKVPASKGATGRIVFAAPSGNKLTASERGEIHAVLTDLSHSPAIASVTNPFTIGTVSRSGQVTYADIRFVKSQAELTETQRQIVATAAAHARADGLQVGVSGDAAPQTKAGGASEGIGILAALLVLTITFGSLMAAGMPLLTAAIGVGIGMTGIIGLSALTDLSSAVTSLAAMLGLAVGIDYALFIISRYRALARRGVPLENAAGQAVGTAGTAVVFAGSTVIIALVALLVTGVPFMEAMGFCAAGTVAIAVLIAITLVPALLAFAGARALKGKTKVAEPDRATLGLRWLDLVVSHRKAAIGLVTALTLVVAIPVTHLRLGLPADSSTPVGTPQRTAGDLLTHGFGEGFNGQLTIVAQLPDSAHDPQARANTIRARLAKLPDVASVAPATLTPDHRLAVIILTPKSGPTSTATTNLVHTIRDTRTSITAGTHADISVTGTTAVNIDVANRMSQALVPYLAVIVGLAFILLAIAFRSLLVPLTAVAGFLLSIGAALGAMVAVFQDGHGASLIGVSQTAPIVSLIPIITIGILFGLAMDYQVFLVSAMREAHAHGAPPQDAVRRGFRHSSRVVTAAGLIMVSVFAGFILPDDPIIKSIGFALTAGVLIDAFLIRMTLIPALMSLLGQHAWYLPRALDRVIPNVDLEGTALRHHDSSPAPAQRVPQPA